MKKDFSYGEILGESSRISNSNFLSFMLIVGLITSPTLLAELGIYVLAQEAMSDPEKAEAFLAAKSGIPILLGLLSLFLGPISTGALTYGVFEQASGRHASTGQCLSVGLRKLIPVALVGFVVGLYIVFGIILLVIPGIYFATMFFVAVPCAVVEHCGAFESMRRSRELTEGYRGQIFWLLVMLFLLGVAVGMLVFFLTGEELTLMGIGLGFLTNCWVAVIAATAGSVAYFRLRQIKEGLDFEELSSVFD
ncbi:MAG: hypothetical protein QF752_02455 [Planctomycetota bacterium]|jgi:hypothetical protein|nr:hypothetical protein [Planctomycetota bacterium]